MVNQEENRFKGIKSISWASMRSRSRFADLPYRVSARPDRDRVREIDNLYVQEFRLSVSRNLIEVRSHTQAAVLRQNKATGSA